MSFSMLKVLEDIRETISVSEDNTKLFFFIICFFMQLEISWIFSTLPYPEKLLITFIAVFLFFFSRFMQTDRFIPFAICLVCVLGGTYTKEPVAGAFLILALLLIVSKGNSITIKQVVFCIFVIVNAITFYSIYYFYVFIHTTDFYRIGSLSGNRIAVLFRFIRSYPWLMVFFSLFIYRSIIIITKLVKLKKLILSHTDLFLVTAFSYFFAIYLLRISAHYYFYPVLLFFIPSLYETILDFIPRVKKFFCAKKTEIPFIIIVLLCCFCISSMKVLKAYNWYSNNIYCRSSHFSEMKEIADLQKCGKKLVFLMEKSKEWQPSDYYSFVISVFISYINDKKENVEKIYQLPDLDDDNIVILTSLDVKNLEDNAYWEKRQSYNQKLWIG